MQDIKKILEDFDADFLLKHDLNPTINIDKILNEKQKSLNKTLSEKLDTYLLLLDEGIKLCIRINELCRFHFFEKKTDMSLVVLTTKIVSTLIGIRKMLYSGLGDCSKTLQRPLIETLDIFYVCIGNKDLSKSFSNTTEMYDNNEFYWKNFSKSKLDKQVMTFFESLKLDSEFINYFQHKRKALKSFLSESIHSSFNSAFTNHIMLTIDLEIDDSYTGKITTAFPNIIVSLLEEIYILNNIFRISLENEIIEDSEYLQKHDVYILYNHYYQKFDQAYNLTIANLEVDAKSYLDLISQIQEALKKI